LVKGIVFDIKRYSIHDGPGIRTTVFLKGCPLVCRWCHNPESQTPGLEPVFRGDRCIRCRVCVDACPGNAISWSEAGPVTDRAACACCGSCAAACHAEAREMAGTEMSVDQVMAQVERDTAFYDESAGGVTFSGGEPLAQPEFLLALLRTCRGKDIPTALDTVGFAPWEILDRLRGFVDLFLYDLKLMDDAKHRKFTGVSNEAILSNLESLSRLRHAVVLRVPVIPGVNDDDENIRGIGTFAAALPVLKGIHLLPYHGLGVEKYGRLNREYTLGDIRVPTEARMKHIANLLRSFELSVETGG